MKPRIVAITADDDDEAYQQALFLEHTCTQCGFDLSIRREPTSLGMVAFNEAGGDSLVHAIIMFMPVINSALEHSSYDRPPSGIKTMDYLHCYVHLAYQNILFGKNAFAAASQDSMAASRGTAVAFINFAPSSYDHWYPSSGASGLRGCKICLVHPSKAAGPSLVSRLATESAKVLCINEQSIQSIRKTDQPIGSELECETLRWPQLQDALAKCQIIVRDELPRTFEVPLELIPVSAVQVSCQAGTSLMPKSCTPPTTLLAALTLLSFWEVLEYVA